MSELIVSAKQLPTIKEGIVKGLEIASGAKSSSTHYHKREDQMAAVKNSVSTLYQISKELPLILATQKGTTGFFIQQVLLNEFKKGEHGGACNIIDPRVWYDEQLNAKIIDHLIYTLENEHGLPYVLRMFEALKTERVNNNRSKKVALRFILGHKNLEYIAVKYRSKLKSILTHCYGKNRAMSLTKVARLFVSSNMFENERGKSLMDSYLFKYTDRPSATARLFLFIMGSSTEAMFSQTDFPVISQFYQAKTDITGCDKLPAEVIVGIIGNKNHPQYSDKWKTKEKREATQKYIQGMVRTTTDNQAMRQTKRNEKLGVEKTVNTDKVTDFIILYKTGYENGFTEEIYNAIDRLAEQKKFRNFMYNKVGVILDESKSMTGHQVESKNTPKAIASFTAKVLSKSADARIIGTGDSAATDVATSFLDLVSEGEYDAIFVISDGYENSYDGLLNEVVEAWRLATSDITPIYHISPITGAEMNARVRGFGNQISTMAVNRPESLGMQLTSKLIEQDIKAWLVMQVKELSSRDIIKKTTVTKNNIA